MKREWKNAPITTAALWGTEHRGPPPIEQEWRELCKQDNDTIVLWAGEWNRSGVPLGWVWAEMRVEEDEVQPSRKNPAAATPASNIERMLTPIAHEARIRIMQTMHDGPRSSGELSSATGLKGGNLYYHLKELIHAAYVTEKDGGYDLTPLGCQLLLTFASIAGKVVKDRGEEGLLVASDWKGRNQ
ncbi:MAG: helix-turn-helix domain-containing protein [Armatimonadetes bacterium]|nr:helix-turn-helix domain-containing protein [Armatimonadota bacterium]NIO75589.1 helix-turn-helix domain-containing protein [Armatimonadota bacterium]NIO98643.1 helix-turn-helix domain-containing protein [Armatimonadota bacterium]